MQRVAALLLTLLGLLGCGDDLFDDFPERLRTETTPPGAVTVRYQGPVQSGFSVEASWRIGTDFSWEDYVDWLRPQLEERGFEQRPAAGAGLVEFRLALPGDAVAVRIEETVAAADTLVVDVSVKAWSR